MVFIYDINTGLIQYFFSGNQSQIQNILNDYPEKKDILKEVIFDDNQNVIDKPKNYKLVVYNGKALTYYKKPKMILTADKTQINGDGVDYCNLNIKTEDLHPLEKQLGLDKPYYLKINGKLQQINDSVIPISSEENNYKIVIEGDNNRYRSNVVEIEVI